MVNLAPEVWVFFLTAIFTAGGLYIRIRKTERDTNGLGKKFYRMVAFHLRCLAVEASSPLKEKLLYLADLIEPK